MWKFWEQVDGRWSMCQGLAKVRVFTGRRSMRSERVNRPSTIALWLRYEVQCQSYIYNMWLKPGRGSVSWTRLRS